MKDIGKIFKDFFQRTTFEIDLDKRFNTTNEALEYMKAGK